MLKGTHIRPRSRQVLSATQQQQIPALRSPVRHSEVSDNLLSNLTPLTILDTLKAPDAALKACLDAASPHEQNLAFKAAIASETIWQWLEELTSWSWPTSGSQNGFTAHMSDSKGATDPNDAGGIAYLGSLPVAIVEQYEDRVEIIQRDMHGLDIEGIKGHVLYNQILPLSRPGTPQSYGAREQVPRLTQPPIRLDDLSALVTATLLQALPNLSKLVYLMSTWTARLRVLRWTSDLLLAFQEASLAVDSVWNATHQTVDAASQPSTIMDNGRNLSRESFDDLTLILQQKVDAAGRTIDGMLNALEGHEDRLPEAWFDEMDSLELRCANWKVSCEAILREADMTDAKRMASALKPAETKIDRRRAGKSEDDIGREARRRYLEAPDFVLRSEDVEAQRPERSSRAGFSPYSQQDRSRSVAAEHDELAPSETPIDARPPADSPTDADAPNLSQMPTRMALNANEEQQAEARSPLASHSGSLNSDAQEVGLCPPLGAAEIEVAQPAFVPVSSHDEAQADLTPDAIAKPTNCLMDSASDSATADETAMHGRGIDLPIHAHSEDDDSTVFDMDAATTMIVEAIDVDVLSKSLSTQQYFVQGFVESQLPVTDVSVLTETDLEESGYLLDSPSTLGGHTNQRLRSPSMASEASSVGDEHLQSQISEILDSLPTKIHLASKPTHISYLNPPDLQLPTVKPRLTPDRFIRSVSSASMRTGTPTFMLAPAARSRQQQRGTNHGVKLYHLSRSTGEAPMKLLIRSVGQNGERVMVRVGGGWADLGEYLREYAVHHGRRSGTGKVEVTDLPRVSTAHSSYVGSSPPSRSASAMASPITPLNVRKARGVAAGAAKFSPVSNSRAAADATNSSALHAGSPETPASAIMFDDPHLRSSSRLSWTEQDSSLGMAGPRSLKKDALNDESRAWVESVKEKVRVASGGSRPSPDLLRQSPIQRDQQRPRTMQDQRQTLAQGMTSADGKDGSFGELGRVGGTKRLFRKGATGR